MVSESSESLMNFCSCGKILRVTYWEMYNCCVFENLKISMRKMSLTIHIRRWEWNWVTEYIWWINLKENIWINSYVKLRLPRHRRYHGFESRWGLNFFQANISNCFNLQLKHRRSFLVFMNKHRHATFLHYLAQERHVVPGTQLKQMNWPDCSKAG